MRRRYRFATSTGSVTCDLPDGAFYLFPNISRCLGGSIPDSVAFSNYLLNEARVAVVPGSAFGAEGYVRISYATSMENLGEGLRRMREAIAKIG